MGVSDFSVGIATDSMSMRVKCSNVAGRPARHGFTESARFGVLVKEFLGASSTLSCIVSVPNKSEREMENVTERQTDAQRDRQTDRQIAHSPEGMAARGSRLLLQTWPSSGQKSWHSWKTIWRRCDRKRREGLPGRGI